MWWWWSIIKTEQSEQSRNTVPGGNGAVGTGGCTIGDAWCSIKKGGGSGGTGIVVVRTYPNHKIDTS